MSMGVSNKEWTIGDDFLAEFDADELLLINPSEDTFKNIVVSAFDSTLPQLRVLAEDVVDDAVRRHFSFAAKAADLVDDGRLKIRTVDELPRNSLLLGSDMAVALITDTEDVFGVQTDSADVVTTLTHGYEDTWTNAVWFDLRTPALSTLRESLRDEFGESFLEEFDASFEAVGPVPRGEVGVDGVALLLLLAAKQDELLYDVGRLGEEIKLASRASFSREKQRFEDLGLIHTEKVPKDVGRPRMRLHLSIDELEEASGEAFVVKARERIEAGA